jgi:hypothetical protein
VTIDVHGSLDRVKDVSSFEAALVGRHLDECGRLAHADHVPLLILPEDTCCRRCVCLPGNEPPAGVTDRPRRALFRPPAKADGILRIRVPFTVTSRPADESGDCSTFPLLPAPVPRSRRPHVLPMAGDNVLWRTLQAPRPALPGRGFGEQDAFTTSLMVILANPRLGLTTQASQRGSVCAAFRES